MWGLCRGKEVKGSHSARMGMIASRRQRQSAVGDSLLVAGDQSSRRGKSVGKSQGAQT